MTNLHAIPITGSKAERLRLRKALLARARSRKQIPTTARRRAHGPQEPTRAKARYMAALDRLVRSTWRILLEQVRPDIEAITRQDSFEAAFARRNVLGKAYAQVDAHAPAAADSASADVSASNRAEMKRLVGFNPRLDPALSEYYSDFRARNVALVKSVVEEQLHRITTILDENFGATAGDLADMLEKQLDVTRSRAMLIARDQTLKFNSQLTEVRMQSAGIDSYIWTTSNDERVREEHAALEGETFRFDSPPSVGNPGADYQCRCSAYPIIPGDEGSDDDG